MVLGMHRSGTSAMTRVISFAGAELPRDLAPGGVDNPSGFWEAKGITELNERILTSLNVAWDDPFGIARLDDLGPISIEWLEPARAALRASYPADRAIVLKDPRLSLLAPLWIEALILQGYAPVAIVMVRSPAEVAASLEVRNGLPHSQGWLLWGGYMICAEAGTRSLRRMFVSFEELLLRPDRVLDRLAANFGSVISAETARTNTEAFLRLELRHHVCGPDCNDVAYKLLVDLADALFAAAADAPLDEVPLRVCQSWLAELSSMIMPIVAHHREQKGFLEAEIRKHKDFELHLSHGVNELRGELDRLSRLVEAKQAEILRLSGLAGPAGQAD